METSKLKRYPCLYSYFLWRALFWTDGYTAGGANLGSLRSARSYHEVPFADARGPGPRMGP